ncbi:MAG: hypothetical protein ACKOYN_00660 [Planctomycetota bacterium]
MHQFHVFRLVRSAAFAAAALFTVSLASPAGALPQTELAPKTSRLISLSSADKPAAHCVVEQTRSGWRARMADGRLLFDRWNPVIAASGGRLAPSSVKVSPVINGVSVEYTYTNSSAASMAPMDLELPILQVISSPRIMDASFFGDAKPIPTTPTPWIGGVYPRDLYSPVTAMTWTGGAVGISLIYPILDYRHDAAVVIRNAGSGRWKPIIGLTNASVGDHWSTVLKHQASVPPGGQRVYRVEIRATIGRGWIETLEPYREHFQRTYGSVRYVRDDRNIVAVQTAMGEFQTATNPEGWVSEAGRPDSQGYGAIASLMRQGLLKSDRVLLWSPTGLHRVNKERNYPFKFVSRWFDPGAPSSMRNAPATLATVTTRPGQRWGLWWGHAAEVQSAWDSASFSPISMSDENSLKLAKRELNLAVSTGARIIGLDAFTHHHAPIWELHPWLKQMTSENPGVTFCTEGRNPDLMHALAPTWVDAFGTNKYQATSGSLIASRFVLADWLLPGHETWAGVMWNRSDRTELQTEIGGSTRRAEIDRLRLLGFVPVLFGD